MLPLFWPHLRWEAPSTLRVSPQVAGLAMRVTLDAGALQHVRIVAGQRTTPLNACTMESVCLDVVLQLVLLPIRIPKPLGEGLAVQPFSCHDSRQFVIGKRPNARVSPAA